MICVISCSVDIIILLIICKLTEQIRYAKARDNTKKYIKMRHAYTHRIIIALFTNFVNTFWTKSSKIIDTFI
jgi:hypothetical protein